MIQTLGSISAQTSRSSDATEPVTGVVAEDIEEFFNLERIPIEELAAEPLSHIVFHSDSAGLAADRYRYLRMRLQELWRAGKLRKLLVTSPLPQDGKSTLVVNLATALSAHGQTSVLVVEADLYHPALVPMLGLKAGPGLAECLAGHLNPFAALRRIGSLGWYFLPAGKAPDNPAELLHGDVLAKVLETLAPHFDWILIDSPPVTLLADSIALAKHADGTLLVVRAGQTARDAVTASVTALGAKNLVDVVLNGVSGLERRYSKYYGSYHKAS